MRHVLIVDDNAINLKLASDLLESEGMRVSRAEDGEAARLLLESIAPDLILMDIGLPGVSGLTLTRQLKDDPRFQHICIVALTAFAMKGDDLKALAAGCDGYITKPINTRGFAREVEAFLTPTASEPHE